MIAAFASGIKHSILEQIKERIFYSIIADCTPDASRREQMSLTIRYVQNNAESSEFKIFERFIEFREVIDKSGKGIADLL